MKHLTRGFAGTFALGAVAVCLTATASARQTPALNALRHVAAVKAEASGLRAALMPTLVPAAKTAGTYTDASGDGNGAPDIKTVTVTSGIGDQILFGINVDSLTLASSVRAFLLLNTDLNFDTGEPDSLGADYIFAVDESTNTYGFGRWTGSAWENAPYSTVQVYSTPTGITISVNRSELGNTNEFDFWAQTISGDPGANMYDDAPDDGSWNFSLQAGGPNIGGFLVKTNPTAGPKAGKPFTVVPGALDLPLSGAVIQPFVGPDSYTCTATLAGRPLTGSGTGGCTWKVPKKTRGKKLAVVVTVTYQGITKSLPFSFRVS